jgi:hypothetical protein
MSMEHASALDAADDSIPDALDESIGPSEPSRPASPALEDTAGGAGSAFSSAPPSQPSTPARGSHRAGSDGGSASHEDGATLSRSTSGAAPPAEDESVRVTDSDELQQRIRELETELASSSTRTEVLENQLRELTGFRSAAADGSSLEDLEQMVLSASERAVTSATKAQQVSCWERCDRTLGCVVVAERLLRVPVRQEAVREKAAENPKPVVCRWSTPSLHSLCCCAVGCQSPGGEGGPSGC